MSNENGKIKKPMTAYFLFANDVREQVKKENAGRKLGLGEMGKLIADVWNKKSVEEKAVRRTHAPWPAVRPQPPNTREC